MKRTERIPQEGEVVGVRGGQAGLRRRTPASNVYNHAVARNQAIRDKQRCPLCRAIMEKREVGWMQGAGLLPAQPIVEYRCPKHGTPMVVQL